jgi:hypothetical protein
MQWSGDAVQSKQQALCVLTLLTLCLAVASLRSYVLYRQRYIYEQCVPQQAASPSSNNSQPELCYPPLDNRVKYMPKQVAFAQHFCNTRVQL